jgi:PTS system cellobiose-specific IIC component
MNNTSTKFSKVLSAVTAFSKNKYVKSVSDSMMTLIGIMVFGSFAVILKAFPIKSVAAFFENIGITP